VLESQPGKAAPAGIFVAPGALGLAVGIWIGRDGGMEGIRFFLPLLLLALLTAAMVRNPPLPMESADDRPEQAPADLLHLAVVALLLVSISVRSFVGMGAAHRCPRGLLLTLGAPLAAFSGKAFGGLLADRLGWARTAVGALLLSAPLIALGGANTSVILAGLLLFQMTMPVTLAGAAQALPGRPATAFGLTCLALIAGAWPTFFPDGKAWYGPAVFGVLIVASATALHAGLRLLKTLGGRAPSSAPEPSPAGAAPAFDQPA
jgi:FSR family fosmidomycin resistance protein-like MFS transporter